MKLKKKIMGIGTAVLCAVNVMAFGVQSLTANAVGYNSGEMTYGNQLSYYKVDEDEDGTDDRIYISGCDKSAASIEIPDEIEGLPVMGINSLAFYNHSNLESVTIPDSITFIGAGAFEGTALANNQTGAKYVGKWVVECDEDTVSVEIKDGTIGIACGAFHPGTDAPVPAIVGSEYNRPVSSLTSVTIPDSVKYIGALAFHRCENLTSVTIPDSVVSIGEYAFWGCESLTSITIPNGVASIGRGTFQDCKSITSLAIPESITSIGEYVFLDCSSLKSINVSENNPNYLSEDGILFSKDKTTIIEFPEGKTDKSYIIPDSVTSISELVFGGCKNLESISIPESVISIGENAFRDCSSLKSITIPESVTSIGDHVFRECSSLKSVTIPESVTSIGTAAFYDCSSLVSVIIPESVTFIDSAAFTFCSSLENITILNPDCEIDDGIVTICNGNVYSNGIFYDGVILGYEGSTAQAYAEKRGYKFNSLNDKPLADPAETADVSKADRIDLAIKPYGSGWAGSDYPIIIDDSGQMIISNSESAPISAAIVKMAHGSKLEADESRYEIEKLSRYQFKAIQHAAFDGISDKYSNSIGDYYIVKFNKNNDPDNILNESEERNAFCNELLESGMAEYVKPTVIGTCGLIAMWDTIDYLKGKDVDSSDFRNETGFTLTFASAEDAQSFEPDSVEGFAENIRVSRTKDNVMYFQLNDDVKGKDMVNVLYALQKSEAVNNVGATIGAMPIAGIHPLLVIPSGGISEIPEDYSLGDTDRNNKIDILDAVNIAKHMGGIEELDELRQILADYNEDGKIDLQDAIGIAKYMADNRNKK